MVQEGEREWGTVCIGWTGKVSLSRDQNEVRSETMPISRGKALGWGNS